MPTRKIKEKYPNINYNSHNLKMYKKTEIPMSMSERTRRKVTNEELKLIKEHKISDTELSIKLKRSVKAIHLIRTKLKYGRYKIE